MSFNKDDPTAAASLKGVGTAAVVKIHRAPREAETPGVDGWVRLAISLSPFLDDRWTIER